MHDSAPIQQTPPSSLGGVSLINATEMFSSNEEINGGFGINKSLSANSPPALTRSNCGGEIESEPALLAAENSV